MTTLRALLAVLVVILAAGNVAWIAREQYGEAAVWDAKVRGAERIIYYHCAPQAGPVFELTGEERTLKVISHATFTSTLFDPRRVTRYAIDLELVSPSGEVQWSDQIHIRSRQSKRGRESDMWINENTFVRAQHVQVSDDRLTRIDLPDGVARGSQLRIRGSGDVDDVLVRAYALKARTPTEARVREASMNGERRQATARRVGLGNWGHYTPAERRTINTARWERMSARGERGIDYEHRYVYYTGFRLPLELAASTRWLGVEPGQPVVLNLQGPSAVRVQARAVAGAANVTMHAVSTAATPAPSSYVVDDEPIDEVFFVREGVHSLRWFTDAAVELRIEALAGGDAQFGKYARERFLSGVLTPDWRRVPAAVTGPAATPVVLPVAESEQAGLRRLRISVRDLPPHGSEYGGEIPEGPVQITLRALDATGAELGRETHEFPNPIAVFDRFETELGAAPVGERTTLELLPAPDATVVEVSASRSTAVLGYHFVPDEETEMIDRPYRDVAAVGATWRAAPHEREDWFLVRPLGWDERVERGETGRLVLQVRLESTDGGDGSGTDADAPPRTARALRPIGAPRQRLIIDQVPGERRSAMLREWPRGSRTRLTSERAVDIRLGAGSGRPAIEYWARASALGSVATISLDGQVREETITATRGRWRLDGAGTTRLRVTLPSNLRALINRPPRSAGGASLVRMRTVYLLGRRAVGLRVKITNGEPRAINAVVYHSSESDPGDVKLIALVDGGEPERHSKAFTRFTPGERTFSIGPARRSRAMAFANVEGRAAGRPRLITIPLGDDLADGMHRVDLTVEGGHAWGRFFVLGSGAGASAGERATSFGRQRPNP